MHHISICSPVLLHHQRKEGLAEKKKKNQYALKKKKSCASVKRAWSRSRKKLHSFFYLTDFSFFNSHILTIWMTGRDKLTRMDRIYGFFTKIKKGTTEIATVGCLDLTAKLVLIYWQYYSNVTQPKQNKLLESVCLCLWKIRAKTRINSKKKNQKNSEEMVEKWSFICFRVLQVMRWLLGLYWFLHPHRAQ